MTADQRPCSEVGTTTLGIARTDAFLVGRDNFEVVHRVMDVVPDAPADGGAPGGER